MEKPFDSALTGAMDTAAVDLVNEAQGVKIAYLQSDEASFLLTDFDKPETQSWFDGNIQKICSVAASIFTQSFNCAMQSNKRGHFDARVFVIPDHVEVENYFIWRQKDARRNATLAIAQENLGHKETHGKSCEELEALLWTEIEATLPRHRLGRIVTPQTTSTAFDFLDQRQQLTALIPRHWQ